MAHAASGNIDPSYKYAWSDVGGWVNSSPTNAGVTVTNSAVTGYAWSANDGWINFDPTNAGVTNNGRGTLGGFAWDETNGWISFSGVTIDSSGKFHGLATGANAKINFDCANCDVRTTWRPVSTTPNSQSSPSGVLLPNYTEPNPLPGQSVSTSSTLTGYPATSSSSTVNPPSSTNEGGPQTSPGAPGSVTGAAPAGSDVNPLPGTGPPGFTVAPESSEGVQSTSTPTNSTQASGSPPTAPKRSHTAEYAIGGAFLLTVLILLARWLL